MTTKIAKVATLALACFQQHSARATQVLDNGSLYGDINLFSDVNLLTELDKNIHNSLQKLLSLIKSLTPQDIGVKVSWTSETSQFQAPVVYVHIMENETFSMSMFVLRHGLSRIPLHDHPGMFGILRVLSGSIRCRSFTRINQDTDTKLSKMYHLYKWQLSDLHPVRLCQDTLITPQSEPCLLTPSDGNLHEITVIGDSAIFLDILAPPYDHDLGTRECKFYKEVELPFPNTLNSASSSGDSINDATNEHSTEPSIVYLVETHPTDYWCESDQYAGPNVHFDKKI